MQPVIHLLLLLYMLFTRTVGKHFRSTKAPQAYNIISIFLLFQNYDFPQIKTGVK